MNNVEVLIRCEKCDCPGEPNWERWTCNRLVPDGRTGAGEIKCGGAYVSMRCPVEGCQAAEVVFATAQHRASHLAWHDSEVVRQPTQDEPIQLLTARCIVLEHTVHIVLERVEQLENDVKRLDTAMGGRVVRDGDEAGW